MAKKEEKKKEEETKKEETSQEAASSETSEGALSGLDKVATFLLYLESISSGLTERIYKGMGEQRSRSVLKSIAGLGEVKMDVIRPLVEESYELMVEKTSVIGGKSLTDQLFKKSYGHPLYQEVVKEEETVEEEQSQVEKPFSFLDTISDEVLIPFLLEESEQMVAFLVGFMSQSRVAELLPLLDQEKVTKILALSVNLTLPSFNIISDFDQALRQKLLKSSGQIGITESAQVDKVTRILEMIGVDQREGILKHLKETNDQLAQKIEAGMFVFNDLVGLADEDMGLILADIKNMKTLAFAVQEVDDALKEKFMSNLSPRQKEILDEELNTLPAKIKPKELESARADIMTIARTLEKEEKISPLVKVAGGASEGGEKKEESKDSKSKEDTKK